MLQGEDGFLRRPRTRSRILTIIKKVNHVEISDCDENEDTLKLDYGLDLTTEINMANNKSTSYDTDYIDDSITPVNDVPNQNIHRDTSSSQKINSEFETTVSMKANKRNGKGEEKLSTTSNKDTEYIVLDQEDNDQEDETLSKKRKVTRKRKASTKKEAPKLTPYQRNTQRLFDNHPELKNVFPDLQNAPKYIPHRATQPEGLSLKLLPFQLEGLHWLLSQENSKYNGGVLADEMGMGKTIQAIALSMYDQTKRPSLVIAPTVALMQWKNEINQHTKGKLKVYLFHGNNKTSDINALSDYDVILTTYAIIESVFRKQNYGFRRKSGLVKEKSVLHSIDFYRVILDEAHNIKDRQSNTARP